MGQRVGDPEQVGARHQIFADALLQREEQITHHVELVLQIDGSAAERTAGVHHGQREIVPDVRVDARQREPFGVTSQPCRNSQGARASLWLPVTPPG